MLPINPERGLALIKEGGVEEWLSDPVEGEFGETRVALIEIIDAHTCAKRCQALIISACDRKGVVGLWVGVIETCVKVLQVKGITEPGEIGFDGISRPLGLPEIAPMS